jgi:hypothetical protein
MNQATVIKVICKAVRDISRAPKDQQIDESVSPRDKFCCFVLGSAIRNQTAMQL